MTNKVIKASCMGCCMGVRRALEMAMRLGEGARTGAQSASGGARHIAALGSLIHNERVISALRAMGTGEITEAEVRAAAPLALREWTIILRAHGVHPDLENAVRASGAEIADATCPKVKSNQKKAASLHEGGVFVFIAGEAEHAEVAALKGYAKDCAVLETEADVTAFFAQRTPPPAPPLAPLPKAALISQTTFPAERFERICAALKTYVPRHILELEIFDTICAAAKKRLEALEALCNEADAIVVVGDKHSANTRGLLDHAAARRPSWLVEGAADLPAVLTSGEYETIGLTAGASAPDFIIAEVYAALGNRVVQNCGNSA